ncbi:helix-turn-helix domain-containing protein [Kutzneria buriramensis]|uniref:Helix-turn-helix protein n=1 Tax=Kutzneria buriramensis TaxID=1045776 RepID=A0A3E0G5F5_9PSEU|nr:helix-turn-helix domain-containing protein [Kutzneria buriramensis]REH18071.1 helix-turn-helix protein [Kutzneria buriramensis]
MTTAQRTRTTSSASRTALLDGPCVTCHVSAGRQRGTRLSTVVCGPCWAAFGGKPAADEIGPEPTHTAPLRMPSGQRHWLASLRRAEWVEGIRRDGRDNVLDIAKVLARHASWDTLETWPGWDTLMARTGLSETTIQRWLQELKLRGWIIVIETGSTPLTRPMALCGTPAAAGEQGLAEFADAAAGVVRKLRGEVEGNRRAVYALRVPLSPTEAVAWAAEQIAQQAAQVAQDAAERAAAEARAKMVTRVRGLLAKAACTDYDPERRSLLAKAAALRAEHGIGPAELTDPELATAQARRQEAVEFSEAMADPATAAAFTRILNDLENGADQAESASLGEEKGWPTYFPDQDQGSTSVGYARARARVVDDCGQPLADPWGGQDQNDALRARFEEEQGWASRVPTSPFEELIAAAWVQRRLEIAGHLTRFAVRQLCRPFWRAGWAGVDLVHAVDHLPSAFGARAGVPINRPVDLQLGRPPAHLSPARQRSWLREQQLRLRKRIWAHLRSRLDAWRTPDGGIRTGYYQTRGRRLAIRKALVSQHGRAAAQVLRDEDLAADVTLTPEHIAAFGRRIAEQLRRTEPARPGRPAVPRSSQATRAAAVDELDTTIAVNRARRAADQDVHQQVRDRYRDQLAAARATLAERTGADLAGRAAPLAPDAADLTPEQRWERARAMAAAEGRRTRRRGGRR